MKGGGTLLLKNEIGLIEKEGITLLKKNVELIKGRENQIARK